LEEYYEVEIRADFLRQHMSPLPSSFVHLATCHSYIFRDVFLQNSADVFLGWFKSVRAGIADGNQVQMVWLMLNGSSAFSAFQDESVTTSYHDYYLHNDELKNQVIFRLYPLPDASSIPRSFHFPAWIETLT
jgi:hypothetical protein